MANQESVSIRKGTTYVFPESACLFAVDASGAVILVEQFRKPKSRTTLELPGGVVNTGESPAESAHREFQEETGLLASECRFLFTLDLDFSTAVHRTHIFSASACESVDQRTHELKVRRLNLGDLISMIRDGSVTHAPTVAAALAIATGF